jgi:hypothetical protein
MNRNSLPWARPRVLWSCQDIAILEGRALNKPSMLITCGSPADVSRWARANRWATMLPCVVFGGDDLESHGVAFGPRDEHAPYRVDNAPPNVQRALASLADQPYAPAERNAVGRYLTAVTLVAAHAPDGPLWWVMAESDQGIGAIRVAASRGACVALAARGTQLGTMGAALAQRLDVDVAVHDVIAGAIH